MHTELKGESDHGGRSEERKIADQYHSVEFMIKDLGSYYQAKIRDISSRGLCVLVREDSNVIEHLRVGDILDMRYYPSQPRRPVDEWRTEIRHITKDEQGRFKHHYLVGLSIFDN